MYWVVQVNLDDRLDRISERELNRSLIKTDLIIFYLSIKIDTQVLN